MHVHIWAAAAAIATNNDNNKKNRLVVCALTRAADWMNGWFAAESFESYEYISKVKFIHRKFIVPKIIKK